MKLVAKPPANVAVLQNKMPAQIITFLLNRSARNPKGILASASTMSNRVCSEPSCESETPSRSRSKGTSAGKTKRAAKLTKLIKASTARSWNLILVSGVEFEDMPRQFFVDL